ERPSNRSAPEASFVTERLQKRTQLLQIRLKIRFVIPPAPHGALVNRVDHVNITWGTNRLLARVLVEAEHGGVPRNSQKLQNTACLFRQVTDKVFVTYLDRWIGQLRQKRSPEAHD